MDDFDVPVIKSRDLFLDIPSSVRLAIVIPTVRWTPEARSLIASMVGVANEEIIILVADNSGNAEKREFLRKLRSINPFLISVCHDKNIGGAGNFFYLMDWCGSVEYSAIMADDDWMSPTYYSDAYKTLLENPQAACAEVGTTFVNFGDGRQQYCSQPSMIGSTSLERIRLWYGHAARVTMYNVSRRQYLQGAIDYLRNTPFHGITLAEDLLELNRLAMGDFLAKPGKGSFLHYPEHASMVGNQGQRFYDLLCKNVGLQPMALNFMHLSTAVQCAMFLMGRLSPITDPAQRIACGQRVFSHIFRDIFIPHIAAATGSPEVQEAILQHQGVRDGFLRYCESKFLEHPVFDREVFEWMVAVVRAFESKSEGGDALLSERFVSFSESLGCFDGTI